MLDMTHKLVKSDRHRWRTGILRHECGVDDKAECIQCRRPLIQTDIKLCLIDRFTFDAKTLVKPGDVRRLKWWLIFSSKLPHNSTQNAYYVFLFSESRDMPGTTRRTTLLSVGNFDAATLLMVSTSISVNFALHTLKICISTLFYVINIF